jgi:glycosyltransferase involved in cell wall biosynthesis
MTNKISIIIPTYNRPIELRDTLNSILNQTFSPKEILIIDDSTNNFTENLIKNLSNNFLKINIILKYIKNTRAKSLTLARNLGIDKSTGNIILFLDDDVILDNNYIFEIIKVYENYDDVLGVQGLIYTKYTFMTKLKNLFLKFFYMEHYKKNDCSILPSQNGTYPHILTETINCQWLSGCNHSFKKEVYFGQRYDENLVKYCFGEDKKFSYKIYLKYPGSLYITPSAKLIHKNASTSRLTSKSQIYMKRIYASYRFYSFNHTYYEEIFFYWSQLGEFLTILIGIIPLPSYTKIKCIYYWLKANNLCIKNMHNIKSGNLNFLKPYLK